ncbi:hypothetical protein [Pedobacter metabolipauper]|uniref:Uncharacterized protein n=1 Tax=Pedobacter metabolipauper TaxID=425513 RepID=A0A4R6SUR9_9SPHI|nr:hypothetical protein [Pedobacter metabolipauper]TDQ08808.1 hypothetical protein ATK78_3327 [Pedobacter metabolipauper]
MIRNFFSAITIGGCLLLLSSFTNSNDDHAASQKAVDPGSCDKIIRFTGTKVLQTDGSSLPWKTVLVIFPNKKQMDLKAEDTDGNKSDISMQIEKAECTFNEKMDSGYASYKLSMSNRDGSTTASSMVLKFIDGKWTAGLAEEERTEKSIRFVFDTVETFKEE